MTLEDEERELIKIDKILTRIRTEFEDYSHITPTNIDEEYEQFLRKNKNYNPVLKYNSYSTDKIIRELKNLNIPTNSEIGKLFLKIKNYLLEFAEQMNNIGTDNFHTEHLFEPIDKNILAKAKKKVLEECESEEKDKIISSKEMGNLFLNELKKYELNDWKIKFDKNSGSTTHVNGGKKEITIREGIFFSEDHLKKLLVHEIGTHVLRSENGREQKYKIFSSGLPNYLSAEEGLASYNEEQQKVSNPCTIKRLARNVIMTNTASKSSFMEVYKTIKDFFEEDEEGDYKTFRMCVRIKRGLRDTSKPGGFLKDHSYFQGLCKIKEYVKQGGDIKKLYAGKIGIKDISLIDKGIIKYPSKLPYFLR